VDATQFNNILTLSPTAILTVRYGFNRFPNLSYQTSQGFNLASLGFDPGYVAAIASPTFPNITDDLAIQPGLQQQFYYVHHSKNFSAVLSKYRAVTISRVASTTGASRRRQRFRQQRGAFTFNGVFTRSTPLTAVSGTGRGPGRHAAGRAFRGTGYIPTKLYEYADYYGPTSRTTSASPRRLTVNAGAALGARVRPAGEEITRMVVGFDTAVPNPLAANVTGNQPKAPSSSRA